MCPSAYQYGRVVPAMVNKYLDFCEEKKKKVGRENT